MTENEIRELVKNLRNRVKTFVSSGWAIDGLINDYTKSADTIEKLFEEIQQYRAIGLTPKMVKEMIESEKLASHAAIIRGAELELYQAIGTIDEFKALKEKSEEIPIIHGKTELELHDAEIRAKAIDDFLEKICEKYTEEERKGNHKQYCASIKQDIADIATEMRGAE